MTDKPTVPPNGLLFGKPLADLRFMLIIWKTNEVPFTIANGDSDTGDWSYEEAQNKVAWWMDRGFGASLTATKNPNSIPIFKTILFGSIELKISSVTLTPK